MTDRIFEFTWFGQWRLLVVAVLSVFLFTNLSVAEAQESTYSLVFPVQGTHSYTDTWGAARSAGRSHAGTDILADKMTPVVAAASGVVGWMHDELGGRCCAMEILHDDGWSSWYIHMNNDTPGTDDGLGWGFAEGMATGVRVEAGQIIGWVGDSGNAESTVSHLHFELHDPSGTAINPYSALLASQSGVGPFATADDFVRQQYQDFLGRDGELNGVDDWSTRLNNGTLLPEDVISNFMASAEFEVRIAPLVRLYSATFLRLPDFDGLMYWADASRSGWSLEQIADEFTQSTEFDRRYGSLDDADFVTLIYWNVLEREPDAQGLDHWVSRLESGQSRGEILVGFSESVEYRSKTENEVVVTMSYLGMLRRAPEPDGFVFWVDKMDAGMARTVLIGQVFGSEEYANRFP